MTRNQIMKIIKDENVQFFRLQFIDINGIMKNVAVPRSQIKKALDGDIMFDGSSIDGFVRINESDMYLKPDYNTFTVLPWRLRRVWLLPGLSAMSICQTARPLSAAARVST